MSGEWPKILTRRQNKLSAWVTMIERDVAFGPSRPTETYLAVAQQDYIAIVARTPDLRFPIVRQYRPAVEQFTWELPAGLVDAGEDPAETCRRELLEETGLLARKVHALGSYAPCTARLSNRVHSFFVETEDPTGTRTVEQGIETRLVTLLELCTLVASGDFVLQLHLGALFLAALRGHIDPDAFAAEEFRAGR